MKAILIIDVDEKTYKSNVTSISFDNRETIFFDKDVKLKPMPQRQELYEDEWEYVTRAYCRGWNDCIDEILGEDND